MKNVEIYEKIAKKYDVATKIVSLGIEEIWRKIFYKEIKKQINDGILLDVGSATGDMAKMLNFGEMILLDPSQEMNKIAKKKLSDKKVSFIQDFAETCDIDKKVDIITTFMAVRNFDDMRKGIKNLDTFLKVGGYFCIVELTKSDSLLFKLSSFYMSKIVPIIGGLITKEYESYKKFDKMIKNITDEEIIDCFDGYEIIKHKRLFPPIASLIIMRKNG